MAFLGDDSQRAAEASECAAEQGQFWPFHDALFARTAGRNAGVFSSTLLKQYAAEVNLDAAAFGSCLDSGRYAAAVRAETEAGRARGVTRTPTLFVNGQKLEGAPTYEALLQVIAGVSQP